MTTAPSPKTKIYLAAFAILALSACASYITPGGSVQLSTLAEADVNELLSKKPTAIFPVNLAIARVQASGYSSYRNEGYGTGRYSVVTIRDVEKKRILPVWERCPR